MPISAQTNNLYRDIMLIPATANLYVKNTEIDTPSSVHRNAHKYSMGICFIGFSSTTLYTLYVFSLKSVFII